MSYLALYFILIVSFLIAIIVTTMAEKRINKLYTIIKANCIEIRSMHNELDSIKLDILSLKEERNMKL